MSTEDPTTTPPDGVGPVPPPPSAPPVDAAPALSLTSPFPAPLVYTPPPAYVPPPAYTPPPFVSAPLYGTPSPAAAGPSLYDAEPEADVAPEADATVPDATVPDVTVPDPPSTATPAASGTAGATTPPASGAGSTGAQPWGTATAGGAAAAKGRRRNPAAPWSVLLGFAALVVALGPAGGGTVMAVLMAAGAFVLAVVAGARAINGAGRGAAAGAVGAFTAVVAVVVAIGTVIAAGLDGDESSDAQDGAVQEGAEQEGVVQEDVAGEDGGAAGVVSPTDVRPLVVTELAHGPHLEIPDAWWYVVVVENPNPEHTFPLAEVYVDAVAADGTLLLARTEYVDALPGSVVAVMGTFHELAGLEPAHVEVRVPVLQDVEHTPDEAPLTTGDLTATASSWGVNVEGVVRSESATDLDMARVVVVARSPDGRILGAARGYVDKLRAGGEAPFGADFFLVLPEDTQYTAYASP